MLFLFQFSARLSINLENKISVEGSVAPRKAGPFLQRIALLAPAFYILCSTALHKATDKPYKTVTVTASPFWSMVGPAWTRCYSCPQGTNSRGRCAVWVSWFVNAGDHTEETLEGIPHSVRRLGPLGGACVEHSWGFVTFARGSFYPVLLVRWWVLWCSLQLLPELICLCHCAANLY